MKCLWGRSLFLHFIHCPFPTYVVSKKSLKCIWCSCSIPCPSWDCLRFLSFAKPSHIQMIIKIAMSSFVKERNYAGLGMLFVQEQGYRNCVKHPGHFTSKTLLFDIIKYWSVNIYRPPTKLWKGNVFSLVCLSDCLSTGGGSNVTITRKTLDHTMFISGHAPCWWHLVAKTRDLFKLIHLRIPSGDDIW